MAERDCGQEIHVPRSSVQDPVEPDLFGPAKPQGPSYDGRHNSILDRQTGDEVQRLLAAHAKRTACVLSPELRRVPRRQAVGGSRQQDEPEPRRQGRTAMALLYLSYPIPESATREGFSKRRRGDSSGGDPMPLSGRGLACKGRCGGRWLKSRLVRQLVEKPRRVMVSDG